MDNFESSNFPSPERNTDPIPFDNGADLSEPSVSHSPLDLGGGGIIEQIPKEETPKIEMPSSPPAPAPKPPTVSVPAEAPASEDRITGVKTFFTKLHAGAIDFLSEQITKWLRENPGITIKRTNVITGEIQGKKTEPNIIITVWY
jgi:hypothetical protein